MKVIYEPNNTYIREFQSLKRGNSFVILEDPQINSDELYMKVSEFLVDDFGGELLINAVRLKTGELFSIPDDTPVMWVVGCFTFERLGD